MTRLQLLLSYTLNKRRDAWLQMGQPESESDQKVFTKGTILRVIQTGVALQGCLIYVNEDFTDTSFSWDGFTINDLDSGYIIKDNIIHPSLFIILTQSQFQAITEAYDPTWVPFSENEDAIVIEDDDLMLILSEVGVPFINIEELEYSRDLILKLAVKPAVLEYFKWFPITEIGTYPITGNKFSIEMPEGAITVVNAYILPGLPTGTTANNPIGFYFDEYLTAISPQGAFLTPSLNPRRRQGFVDTDSYSTFILERAARQGIVNYSSRTRVRVNIQKGMVTGYSTKRGTLEVMWGYWSNLWRDIPFTRQSEVRELSKANILRNLAMLRSQAKSDIPGTLDYSGFLTRADQLEEKIITLWRDASKAVVIRS